MEPSVWNTRDQSSPPYAGGVAGVFWLTGWFSLPRSEPNKNLEISTWREPPRPKSGHPSFVRRGAWGTRDSQAQFDFVVAWRKRKSPSRADRAVGLFVPAFWAEEMAAAFFRRELARSRQLFGQKALVAGKLFPALQLCGAAPGTRFFSFETLHRFCAFKPFQFNIFESI